MAITFKNGSFKGTALCLDTADKEAILAFLQEKAKYENIALWIKTNPLVLDLGQVSGEDPDLAEELLKTVEDSGFKCTGVMETGNKDTDEALRRRGHVIVPAFKTPQEIQLEEQAKKQAQASQSNADPAGQNANTKNTGEQKTGSDDGSEDVRKDAESGRGQPCTITGNVRSGRQVYIKNNSLAARKQHISPQEVEEESELTCDGQGYEQLEEIGNEHRDQDTRDHLRHTLHADLKCVEPSARHYEQRRIYEH